MKGINRIEKAINVFSKIKDEIKKGIDSCTEEAMVKNDEIESLQNEVIALKAACEKGAKVIYNINKITEIEE